VRLQRRHDIPTHIDLEQHLLQLALPFFSANREDLRGKLLGLRDAEAHQLHEPGPGLLHVELTRHDVDVVRWPVRCQHHALSVANHSARGGERDPADHVAAGLRAMARRLNDLQLG
jgi:hypothetical protein